MKRNLFILLSAALLGTTAYSQTGGGASGGATGSAGGSGSTTSGAGPGVSAGASAGTPAAATGTTTTTSSSTSGGVRVNQQPLLPGGATPVQTPNPNLPVGQVPPPNTAVNSPSFATNPIHGPLAVNTNGVPLDPNQPILNTSQFNTNQAGVAGNQTETGLPNPNLTPTSASGSANRVFATNAPGLLTNTSPLLMHDQAISEVDRRLLAQIRAAVFGANHAAAPLAGAPVHFILKDGSVRLVGTVSSEAEKQRIENQVQQVPGVVRVFDALQIGAQGQVNQPDTQPTAQ